MRQVTSSPSGEDSHRLRILGDLVGRQVGQQRVPAVGRSLGADI